jgi:predicted TIM-barrel fold metal-dependent hydrolase
VGLLLSERELAELEPAESAAFHSPVPTQMVSNGEFVPLPQTSQQRKVEARIKELADAAASRLGMDRRQFLRTASGMATAFLAMNEVFGLVFKVNSAEAAEPETAAALAKAVSNQFVFDGHLHMVRDDYSYQPIVDFAKYAAAHWSPEVGKSAPMTLERFKFDNFLKEVYLDSDTTVGLLTGAPFDDPAKWFLTNDQIKQASETVNKLAGSKRLLFHSLITPGQPGWMDEIERCISDVKPSSWKGYTIGDPLSPQTTKFPYRLDDEVLMYPFYDRVLKAGITTVCVHKGLLPKDYEKSIPGGAWAYATVDDVPRAAKDWPSLNFVIYHSAMRAFIEDPSDELAEFERTGYIRWVTDLARIPEKHGVTNVYADTGTCFAISAVSSPRLCAAMMGTLIKGLGSDHVFWGTDSVWYGSPQWQIEAFRRMEIPEDLQRKFGFAPLGPAEGSVKSAILGRNSARLYKLDPGTSMEPWRHDHLGSMKKAYLENGPTRNNMAYGYVKSVTPTG